MGNLSGEINKIVVFRALQLGDMLCSIPAFRALRHAYPKAYITLVGLPWATTLLDRFPNYLDAVIKFPGYPGLPEQSADVRAFPTFLNNIHLEQFDLAIQMQGNGGISNPVVKLFNAKQTAGYYSKGSYCPNSKLFIEYPATEPEIQRHLKLMSHLGIEAQGTDLEFPLSASEEAELQRVSIPVKRHEYVCIHPGARGLERRWSPENFAAVGDFCNSKGLVVVITGTKEELPIVESVAVHMKKQPIIAAGKTSLGAMGVLINNSVGLISNCTGVSHMAAAFKTPSVVISLHEDPIEYHRWAPLNKDLHAFIDWPRTPDLNIALQETERLIGNRS